MTTSDRDGFYACLWQIGEHDFKAGIVGSGPGFLSILELLSNTEYREFIPGVELVAVAEPDYNLNRVRALETGGGITVHPTCQAMLDAHPEIDLLIELGLKQHRLTSIRSSLPGHVTLIDHVAAIFLCSLHSLIQVKTHCQMNLDRQKALLEAIIDEIRDDILVLDLSGKVEDMNRHVRQRARMDKPQARGLPCHAVQKMEGGQCFCCNGPDPACPFFTTIKTKAKAEAMMTRVGPDGRLRYYRVYAYPILGAGAALEHVLIMRRDITTRTHGEKHRQHMEKLTIVGEMSTYLAHEIRNPLCAIGGFSNSLLRSENLDPGQREKLSIISQEAKRLEHMLTSVLNFARPARTSLGRADLNRTAEDTVELMRIGYAGKDMSIETRLADPMPLVMGESEMIKQCLVNLIKNSMEAMPEGGTITVSTAMDSDMAALIVADQGQGMSKDQLENVLTPFYTTKEQGYGLGLAMIKKIMEEFGGSVDITSRPGRGTSVTLLFAPVLAVEETQPRSGDAPDRRPAKETSHE